MKTNHTITCPECQHSFSIESAFANQLRGKIEAEVRTTYDARFAKERDIITRELTRAAQAEAARSHAIPVLVSKGFLRPLASPLSANAPRRFSSSSVEKLAGDADEMNRMQQILTKHHRSRNGTDIRRTAGAAR